MPKLAAQVEIAFDGRMNIDMRETAMAKIAENPTAVLAKRLIISVNLSSGWSYVSEDSDMSHWLRKTFEKFESRFIRSGCNRSS